MKGPLRHYGYPPTESVAVLAASAAMGETIPPSLMLLVLGSITTLSVGSLFVAGLLPAAVSGDTFYVSTPTGNNAAPMSPQATTVAGGSQPHDNTMPTLTARWCIAFEGIFPSQN